MTAVSRHAGMVHVTVMMAMAMVPAVLAGVFHPRSPAWVDVVGPGEVTLDTVRGWATAPMWIDARTASAFAAGHRDGAVPLNLTMWQDQIQDVIERWVPGQPLVIYCDQQACHESAQVARKLREDYRLPDVWVLHGGWRALQAVRP